MSIVADQVRRLDAQIDRISLVPLTSLGHDGVEEQGSDGHQGAVAATALSSPRVTELLKIVRSLSSSSTSGARLQSARIQRLILRSGLADHREPSDQLEAKSQTESDIEWLLVGKATVQTYGLLLDTLLDQIIPLSDDIWYWDEVLGSYPYSFMYTAQTSPLRMWAWSKDIYQESLARFQRLNQRLVSTDTSEARSLGSETSETETPSPDARSLLPQRPSLSSQWRQFYSIVRESIAERSMIDIRRRILSPVDICRSQARAKQARLRKLREMTSTGLGILMDEGLNFGGVTDEADTSHEWRGVLERSVALMDMIIQNTLSLDVGVPEFEDKVFAGVEEDPEFSIHADDVNTIEKPSILARRILAILQSGLPGHVDSMSSIARENGRPSRIIRYWIPAVALLVSSSTILRILVNRHDDIINWIRDLGTTTRDFWFNWVVSPIRQIIGTIRHDSSSEIAIMSRDSLKADRDSLERMVVDFATDKPGIAVGASSITDAQIAEIRFKVREGDVTPVLKAYERDMKQPFVGAIKGDLVRSLLIQVQKTKVDLEVAISGIDALLKSQELVFGFLGLTPGILVSIGVFQYLRTVFGSRKGLRRGQRARRSVRVLRKIDRILSEATPSQNNVISYKDHGMLVCEVHILRTLVKGVLPGEIEKEFVEDLDELATLQGIQVQMRALDRIRWAYAEWLSRMKN
ncbi:ATP synthase regulation protein NCA2-domain-containing protein [Podospora appendiculata]|uniref:ATP synthase regulation protein NCA2-domain-containing protein n=1 Tax=Podospora appendiculata TaxID=314037 RepID=A0AAE1CBK5_9PEZI|nr:ATP synthase regulation protein NCA2-domain-containing protein [Podospora appendiculata]